MSIAAYFGLVKAPQMSEKMMRRSLLVVLLSVATILVPPMGMAHTVSSKSALKAVDVPSPSAKAEPDRAKAGTMNAVVNAYKLWRTGSKLEVCFYKADPEARSFFVTSSRAWESAANIRFDYGTGALRSCDPARPSHIRVDFGPTGHWSRVGTDSIAQQVIGEPSLNIDFASFGTWSLADKEVARGTVLHELGHALGLEHEHQSPKDPCIAGIKWKTVYAEMAKPPNGWDKDKVDFNLGALVNTGRLRTSAYDPKSIMHYAFPARWFANPACANPGNEDLSPVDRREAALAYPTNLTDQGKFIAGVSQQAVAISRAAGLTDSQKNAMQKDIATVPERLAPGLRDAAVTVSVGNDNTGILFGGSVSATSSGPCSPVLVGTQGNATITFGGTGPVNCQAAPIPSPQQQP